ncbi:uncharacterized protein A1O9_03695 [Exophiala aquamarina CBS 119918]|uniref:Carboxylic ester hydrolase n=1 Tax=Exophiala aquamarina CBS 119918 TaxID=1182545 RepID=A0A072PGI7_9EURO|nr:uncharacterized protein A1O9_03695 [Exophiala aquamarina CBS 119918]KEF58852.1 hypothetical protein A1O9_03695 [Exophiala aquamarina CBS 119918]
MGLKEAQNYPEDFDGIPAGAPGWWETRLLPFLVRQDFLNLPSPAPGHLTAPMFLLLLQEMVTQCDPQDGVTDGIIMQPTSCNFSPEALLCSPDRTKASGCFKQPQIDTINRLLNDWTDSKGNLIFPALAMGSYFRNNSDVQDALAHIATTYIVNMLLNDTNWDWRTFNDSLVLLADRIDPCNANTDQFDMTPFKQRGGKSNSLSRIERRVRSATSEHLLLQQCRRVHGPISFRLLPAVPHP